MSLRTYDEAVRLMVAWRRAQCLLLTILIATPSLLYFPRWITSEQVLLFWIFLSAGFVLAGLLRYYYRKKAEHYQPEDYDNNQPESQDSQP